MTSMLSVLSGRAHSRAIRTSPQRISLTSWLVGIDNSRSRVGFIETRSCWMQNQTWPRRWPKIVPMTIDFDGRGGTIKSVVLLSSGEVGS